MERTTKQRTAILKCLAEKGRPLSVDEILAYTAIEIPQISLSTIYRTIKTLIQKKKITIIKLPGKTPCYEIFQREHHHHFLCDGCSKVYFINECPKGLCEIIPKGFHLKGHSITLNGICVECH